MDFYKFFTIFLIIFLPLTLPLLWWISSSVLESSQIFFLVFIIQIIISTILFSILGKDRIKTEEFEVNERFSVNERFISLYERSPVPYLVINRQGEIVMYNPATVNFLATDMYKISGLNFLDLILETEDKKDLTVLSGKITFGDTIKEEKIKLKILKNENFKWVSMSVYNYEVKNQRLISLIDITQEKLIDTAKSEFVALATHQLRTPISAIRWNLELLEKNMRETKTENQSRYLMKIERNTLRMIALINDFLSVSKLEMGTFASSMQEINLTEFFTSILDEYSEKITEKNLDIKRNDEPNELIFKSDSRLLHIIVSNLISNAVKYVGNNGEINLSFKLVDKQVFIDVADNGIGIPEGELEKLFSKFYRASNAQSRQSEGTGLGLYIVKQSVEKLGGKIQVVSGLDKGAKFTVILPYFDK